MTEHIMAVYHETEGNTMTALSRTRVMLCFMEEIRDKVRENLHV